MSNDISLFRLYIVIILFFLVPLSFIITLQIYDLLRRYILTYSLISMFVKDKKFMLPYRNYNNFFDLLLDNRKTFLCISSAELFIKMNETDVYMIYILLAYCYQRNNFFYIAEYYYLKANHIMPQNQLILSGLANVYRSLGDIQKLDYVNSQINVTN